MTRWVSGWLCHPSPLPLGHPVLTRLMLVRGQYYHTAHGAKLLLRSWVGIWGGCWGSLWDSESPSL